ncbi:MAG: polysaccharide biosynthesis tyrosine autokinase, partial [Terriglobales bacterium]
DPPPGATTSGTRGKAALGPAPEISRTRGPAALAPAPEISRTPAAALGPAREANALLASDEGAMLRPSYESWQAAQLAFQLMRTTRGPANPAYQAAQLALNNAQAQLGAAVASVREQIDSKYQRAQDQMTLVSRQLAAARIAAQNFNEKEIDYDTRKRNLDADQKLYDGLRTQIKQQQLMASASSSALRITNPATPDPDPVSPNLSYNLALALLASVFGGCGVAVLAGYLDSSFTSPQGVEQYLHLPLLGALPAVADQEQLMEQARPAPPDADAGPDPADPAASPFTEAILMLRTAVLAAAPQGLRTLSITSAEPQEGKSIVLANLAMALALHGAKVLLVDADVRRPLLHRLFNAPNRRGLSDLLRQETGLEECLFHTGIKKLYLLPAGAAVANPGELIGTMLPHLLPPVSAEFDYVLFDSPPMLGYADAVAVATSVEGTLLVARAGKTPRDAVQAALVPLQRARARVLGLVLNQITRSMSPYYAYHRDHYARYLRRA